MRLLIAVCPSCLDGLASEAAGGQEFDGLCETCWAVLLQSASMVAAVHRPTERPHL